MATSASQSPQCFACFKPKLWRTYDVNGKKWKKERVNEKLQGICGEEAYRAIQEENIGLCHSCLCRLQTSFSFADQIRQNLTKLGLSDTLKTEHASGNVDNESVTATQSGTQLLLEKQILVQWRKFAKKHNMQTDSEVASALLKACASTRTLPTSWCDKCSCPLILCCTSCEQKTRDSIAVNAVYPKASSADFACMYPEVDVSQDSSISPVNAHQQSLTISPVSQSQSVTDMHGSCPCDVAETCVSHSLTGKPVPHSQSYISTGASHVQILSDKDVSHSQSITDMSSLQFPDTSSSQSLLESDTGTCDDNFTKEGTFQERRPHETVYSQQLIHHTVETNEGRDYPQGMVSVATMQPQSVAVHSLSSTAADFRYTYMFPLQKGQNQGHHGQRHEGQGHLLDRQLQSQHSLMVPECGVVSSGVEAVQPQVWTDFSHGDSVVKPSPSEQCVSRSHHKSSADNPLPPASREEVAASNTLLELFESNSSVNPFVQTATGTINPLVQAATGAVNPFVHVSTVNSTGGCMRKGGHVQNSYQKKKAQRKISAKDGKPRPFVCGECGMAFFTSTILRRHARIHTGEKPFKCSHCGDSFRQSNGLKRHVLAVHSSNKRYACRRCNASFPAYRLLMEHRRTHEELRRFTCDACGAGFRRQYDLKVHKEAHNGTHVQIQCRVCNTLLSTVTQLRRHERSKHSNIADAKYKCTECSRAFRSPHSLKEHIKAHIPGGPYLCHVCSEASSTLFEARKHVYSVHPGEKVKLFSCDVCGKCFTSEAYARFHQAAHSGQKSYVCGQCGASFHYPTNLHAHQKIHTGIRNYICKHCGDKFLRPPHLKKHMKLHEGEMLLPCPVCGVSFNSKRSLSNHMHSHDKKDKRRFVCEVCGMKQWTASGLRQHMRMHTGEKPHICEICGAAFTWSSGLQYHMRYHDNKNCVCEVCGAGFIWKSELKNHMDSHMETNNID